MGSCARCGGQLESISRASRRETCVHCGADLHICLNCRFYSEAAHNKCIETKAEHQRDRDKANFCDYFQWGGGKSTGSSTGSKADAKTDAKADAKADALKKLDDLFGPK